MLDHGAMTSLSKGTVVDIWVNSADARRVLDKGYQIVHAAADYFYLVGLFPVEVVSKADESRIADKAIGSGRKVEGIVGVIRSRVGRRCTREFPPVPSVI